MCCNECAFLLQVVCTEPPKQTIANSDSKGVTAAGPGPTSSSSGIASETSSSSLVASSVGTEGDDSGTAEAAIRHAISTRNARITTPCDFDKVIWTAPQNESNMDDGDVKGVSECLFSSIKSILNGNQTAHYHHNT